MGTNVFYCSRCKETFAGKDFSIFDKPKCPKCNNTTFSTGFTKEEWLQMPKEERQSKLAALAEQKTVEGEPLLDSGVHSNIGKRIKSLANLGAAIEAFLAFIAGIVLFSFELFLAGALVILLGFLFAWISSWGLYAFGELVDKTCMNEQNTRNILELMKKNPKA